MAFMTVYKIRNGAGLWSNGGYTPRFSTRGKIWNTRGSLNSHISQISSPQRWDDKSTWKMKPDDWEIFEIVVETVDVDSPVIGEESKGYEAKVNVFKVNDVIKSMKRKQELSKEFNQAFSDLVERIEKNSEQASYQWAIIMDGGYTKQDKANQDSLLSALKACGLKRNTDYRSSITAQGSAVAFKNKSDAMRVRLTCTAENIEGVDIVNYMKY
jgi:hypothetical protein